MKRSFIIGIVWTGLVVCVISFGATVFFLENAKKVKINQEAEGVNEQQDAYITDESSIRTNNLASLNEDNNVKISTNLESIEVVRAEEQEKKNFETQEMQNNAEIEAMESISTNASAFVRPVNGEIINPLSTESLIFSKTLQEWNIHNGTDYKAKLGDEVYAVRSGKIKEIKYDYIYGEYIIIEHDNGYESLYANITVLDALHVGDELSQGELIGYVAESFGFEVAEETHLHFELKKDGKYLSI